VGGPSWQPYSDPLEQAGAPIAQAGALTSWVSSADNIQHIVYIDHRGHIIELYAQVGGPSWQPYSDPTEQAGAPLAQGGALTSWVFNPENLQQLAFVDTSGHPEELLVHPRQPPWTHLDFYQGSTAVVTDFWQTVRLTWALARDEDRYGNGINYRYTLNRSSSPDGEPILEFRPDTISYTDTANNSWPALKSVEFVYEPRPDKRVFYVSGLRMSYANRLHRIEVRGPNPVSTMLLRSYKLDYRNDSVSQRSLLSAITECDGADVCKAPLSFGWELGSMSFLDIDTGVHDLSVDGSTLPEHGRFEALTVADINGDGLSGDAGSVPGWYYRTNSGYKAVMSLRDPFNARQPGHKVVLPTGAPWPAGLDNVRFVDMDRDGRADLIVTNLGPPNVNVEIYTSPPYNPTTGLPAGPFSTPAYQETVNGGWLQASNRNVYAADIDGNGYPDLLISKNNAITWYYNANTGPYFDVRCNCSYLRFSGLNLLNVSGETNLFAVDVDGDGTPEMMLRNPVPPTSIDPGMWYTAAKVRGGSAVTRDLGLIAGEVFPNGAWCWGGAFNSFRYPCFQDVFVDLNGDGLPDLVSVDNSVAAGNPRISLNSGNGFHNRVEVHVRVRLAAQPPPFLRIGSTVIASTRASLSLT
jgi:hypothetical protein